MSSLRSTGLAPFKMKFSEKGTVKDIKKNIVRIDGLPSCLNGQIVDFGDQNRGIVMGFSPDEVLVLVLGEGSKIRMGQTVSGLSEPFTVAVGSGCLGRMLDARGLPIDDGVPIEPDQHLLVFGPSPLITERAPVDAPLCTGTKIIDVLVPVAKGQRQLILGDRMTGKTVVAVDAILNQRGANVICIYCCIGKAVSALEKVLLVLSENSALDYSIIIAATDNTSAGEQYIAPFTAATIGEFFMRKGRDVLVVFDDVTKHAWAYRQLSLLLERPPGREAYPGDIFYLHTQLMERAGRMSRAEGGGSMTFLGIADTLQGDLTGYIPSNLISMCDGQVVLSTTLFSEGMRPAVEFLLSMSIVGGRAQFPILRTLGATLRMDYMQYVEVERLSKLQGNLSREADRVLKKGRAILALLQQNQYQPASIGEEVLLLYALQDGRVIELASEPMSQFKQSIYPFAQERDAALLKEIEAQKTLTPEIESGLQRLLNHYFKEAGAAAG